ncbi:small integral membrane protein 22 [Trichomycterus rosablanca]|uniref:small integral membrane protein 22 n=1 Tax=Trichomycterus rosablanca TaxID=2290929 RepID=UPI002F3504CD
MRGQVCLCNRCYPEIRAINKIRSLISVTMDQKNLQQEFQNQLVDVFSRMQSKQLFQSDWDVASFALFFIFIGMVLLLVILVLIRCCCCCCHCDDGPKHHKVGVDNMALEP